MDVSVQRSFFTGSVSPHWQGCAKQFVGIGIIYTNEATDHGHLFHVRFLDSLVDIPCSYDESVSRIRWVWIN